jgi:TonB family protein
MMMAGTPLSEIPQPAPVPRLLIDLPSWPRAFFGNLRDLFFRPRLPRLELQSAPAPFWPDVFVKRGLPWRRFLDSVACHFAACALLIGLTRFFALQPQAVLRPTFDHTQVVYYQAAEYLPPLDTRSAHATQHRKADPEFSPQPIISVPAEADNPSQTIVTPPAVRLKHDVALPNIVAWSDKEQKPQLAIPAAPLTLAAELSRIAPRVDRVVVAAPLDAAHLIDRRETDRRETDRREQRTLQSAVVAPPVDLRDVHQSPTTGFQSSEVIMPPPSVEAATTRPIGDLNIGRTAVIAPAPQLAVGEQRTVSGGRASAIGGVTSQQVVAPPPAISAGSAGASFGSRGRVIALNLHPSVGAPSNPPGNRRGTFAATPEGHAGTSGAVGSTTSTTVAGTEGIGSNRKGSSDLPAGLYVGKGGPATKTSPVAGDPTAKSVATNSVNPNLTASVRPARVTSAPSRPMQPDSATKLSEAEREVFGNRKFYSLTLNMPNLNSAGGSWVIHFAELDHAANSHDSHHDSSTPAEDLSQPAATRKVDPSYPLQLMRENVAGTVILYAVIHADGTVGSVKVLRGVDDRLDQFASAAVAQWKFQPATKNGAPVDVEATFQIPFRPGRVGTNF